MPGMSITDQSPAADRYQDTRAAFGHASARLKAARERHAIAALALLPEIAAVEFPQAHAIVIEPDYDDTIGIMFAEDDNGHRLEHDPAQIPGLMKLIDALDHAHTWRVACQVADYIELGPGAYRVDLSTIAEKATILLNGLEDSAGALRAALSRTSTHPA